MLAAENAAIENAKAGGMGDVVRDLPLALAELDVSTDIIMPDYGRLVTQENAEKLATIMVNFGGKKKRLVLYVSKHPKLESNIYFVQHPLWRRDGNDIYVNSGDKPFADDADCFALFAAAVATFLQRGHIAIPDVFHLNDWHSGFFSILTEFDPDFAELKDIRKVLTVHNLALQGTRPMAKDKSSLAAWYPELYAGLKKTQLTKIKDPRYKDCMNPLRAAINLCDGIHIVSPTYAGEILKPSRPKAGFFGGEGLEKDLRKKVSDTLGVLNGHIYSDERPRSAKYTRFLMRVAATMTEWQALKPLLEYEPRDKIKLLLHNQKEPEFLMTSVGRLTDQKVLLLRQSLGSKRLVIDAVLEQMADYSDKAFFIMLGSGDPKLETIFHEVAMRHTNFLFLNGYNEEISEWLYDNGDLFLMPSSFEPCGISQMLAMQYGQPCLVHGVGGLNDTVKHLKNGFVFQGKNLKEQGSNLIAELQSAIKIFDSKKWQTIVKNAKAARFTWQNTAKEIAKKLY